jgi:hypothetical protein
MTLEQLLDCSADVLEKMSDAKLLKHFEPFLDVTRPERARAVAPKKKTEITPYISPSKKNALKALEAMGIDPDLLRRRKGRK